MSCDAVGDVLLDLARGVPLPGSSRLAVEEHVRDCSGCAIELDRQRRLTAALQDLSADALGWRPSAGLEARLLAAFDARRAADVSTPASRGSARWTSGLALAAVVVLAAWLGGGRESPPARSATSPAPEPAALATPAMSGRAASSQAHPAAAAPPAVSRAGDRPGPVRTVRAGGRRSGPLAQAAPKVRSFEFVALPTAAGLPDLESGSVVRIEVPVAALPGYGVDLVPHVLKTTVEADVLVGQDGQPRAIRLVTADEQAVSDSRSKP